MGDTRDHYARIEACLANLGRDGFIEPFLTLSEGTGAAQIMVFSYRPDRAACLLSRNFRQGALGAQLSAQYLDGWFLHDPLFTDVMALSDGQAQFSQDPDLSRRMNKDYRARFFEQPDLAGKSAFLLAGQRLRLVANFYWQSKQHDDQLCPLLARMALLHFEARSEHGFPAPLDVLSDRERAVCLGMLEGKKTELIAQELSVAPSSVITYRRRAYAKLGINSRGSLFALCRT